MLARVEWAALKCCARENAILAPQIGQSLESGRGGSVISQAGKGEGIHPRKTGCHWPKRLMSWAFRSNRAEVGWSVAGLLLALQLSDLFPSLLDPSLVKRQGVGVFALAGQAQDARNVLFEVVPL